MANEILQFCTTDTGTNLLTEAEYLASSDRTSGSKPGIASSKLNNRALRQTAYVASALAQYAANTTGADVLDDAVTARFQAQLVASLKFFPPRITTYTTGSGNFNSTFIFMIASGNATAAATYTNNAVTYTVVETVASSLSVKMTGNGDPSVSGTLTKATGSGDSTLTFYAVRAPLYLGARVVGGGGGGGGSGSSGAGNGGAGGNTTFGSTVVVANGGAATTSAGGVPGAGGSASLGTGATGVALSGGAGSGVQNSNTSNILLSGGPGAVTPFGGAGQGGTNSGTGAGGAAIANSGSGGGGGAAISAGGGVLTGAGGSAGGYADAIITAPLRTYAYAIGAAGSAGSAGTTGYAGGAGGSGFLMVTEYFS